MTTKRRLVMTYSSRVLSFSVFAVIFFMRLVWIRIAFLVSSNKFVCLFQSTSKRSTTNHSHSKKSIMYSSRSYCNQWEHHFTCSNVSSDFPNSTHIQYCTKPRQIVRRPALHHTRSEGRYCTECWTSWWPLDIEGHERHRALSTHPKYNTKCWIPTEQQRELTVRHAVSKNNGDQQRFNREFVHNTVFNDDVIARKKRRTEPYL